MLLKNSNLGDAINDYFKNNTGDYQNVTKNKEPY